MTRLRRFWALMRGWYVPAVAVGWAVLLIVNLVGPKLVVLPGVAATSQIPTPFVFFVGGLIALLSLLLATEPCPEVFVTSPLRSRLLNVTRVVVAVMLGPLLLTSLGPGDTLAALSTSMAVAGEGLLAASVLGLRLAWLPPLLHLTAAGSFGAATPDTLRPWAWLISANPSAAALASSAVMLAAGGVSWFRAMARRPSALIV